MSEAGGCNNSWVSPSDVWYCTGSTDSQFDDQDEDEQRHRERQHERRDPHADRRLDLIAHLHGDGLEEQLHTVGNTRDVTLARRKNASAITITAAIAVASTVSVLTVRPNQFGLLVVTDFDWRLRRGASQS